MSGAPDQPVPIGVLREAVRRAVAASSIRAVADATGMSKTAVVKFLAGSKPHASSIRLKLLPWYVREAGALDADATLGAIAVLVNTYPEEQRERVRDRLVEVLREAHDAAGREPPEWMK